MDKLISQWLKKKAFPLKSQGASMLPILRPDDIVYFKKISFAKIKTNDIIVIRKNRQFISHRVIYKSKNYLITKGDNNSPSDGKIYPRQIIGKVYQAKRNGQFFNPESLYLLQSTLYFQEIVKIKTAFELVKIDFVFLKGLPLHLYFEKSHPRRLYLDCDVLVKKLDFFRAEKILLKFGYKKGETSLSRTHQMIKEKEIENAYVKMINGFPVVFDLHLEVVFLMTQLGKLEALYPQKLIDELTSEFLKTKREVKINNEKFLILNTEYLILYLSLHFFHHNLRGAFRLELMDKVIRKKQLTINNWQSIKNIIKQYQLQNFVYPVFVLLKKYYQTPLPQSFLKQIQPSIFQPQNLSSIFYPLSSILKVNIFADEPRITAGITRFTNLFFLSPRPLYIKLLIFFNRPVLYSIFWVFLKKLSPFFSNRKSTH